MVSKWQKVQDKDHQRKHMNPVKIGNTIYGYIPRDSAFITTGRIFYPDGEKQWYKHGKLHRDDGPAVIMPNGYRAYKAWYKNGERHREDGPAVICSDGCKAWWRDGKRHREDGPAWINPNGTRKWYQNGKLHRDDGPAMINADGTKEWYQNGTKISKEDI